MTCATLLVFGIMLAGAQTSEESQRAIAIVKKSDGKVFFDEKAPGKPVVGVNL
jgi:hypothetical protein